MRAKVSVRLLRPWRHFKQGHVLQPVAMLRQWLVRNKLAEIVTPEEPKVERAMLEPAAEKAVAPAQKRRKRN